MPIIGITGRAGSGKDTFADLDIFKSYTKESFAEPINDAVIALFGLTPNHIYDVKLKNEIVMIDGKPAWFIDNEPASPRLMRQWVGTDMMRNHVDDKIFIKLMARKLTNPCHIIIADVRFENEAKFVKEHGGLIFKILRPELEKKFADKSVHASEQGIPYKYIDHVVINEENRLDILREQADFVYNKYLLE